MVYKTFTSFCLHCCRNMCDDKPWLFVLYSSNNDNFSISIDSRQWEKICPICDLRDWRCATGVYSELSYIVNAVGPIAFYLTLSYTECATELKNITLYSDMFKSNRIDAFIIFQNSIFYIFQVATHGLFKIYYKLNV